jgi:hypothetical protein
MMKSLRQAIAIALFFAVSVFAGLAAQESKVPNPLDNLLKTAFTSKNPIERVSWSASEVVVVGSGSYGDQVFRNTYKIGLTR